METYIHQKNESIFPLLNLDQEKLKKYLGNLELATQNSDIAKLKALFVVFILVILISLISSLLLRILEIDKMLAFIVSLIVVLVFVWFILNKKIQIIKSRAMYFIDCMNEEFKNYKFSFCWNLNICIQKKIIHQINLSHYNNITISRNNDVNSTDNFLLANEHIINISPDVNHNHFNDSNTILNLPRRNNQEIGNYYFRRIINIPIQLSRKQDAYLYSIIERIRDSNDPHLLQKLSEFARRIETCRTRHIQNPFTNQGKNFILLFFIILAFSLSVIILALNYEEIKNYFIALLVIVIAINLTASVYVALLFVKSAGLEFENEIKAWNEQLNTSNSAIILDNREYHFNFELKCFNTIAFIYVYSKDIFHDVKYKTFIDKIESLNYSLEI